MAGILAKKVEMTRVVKGDKFVPVTLLEVPTLKVVGKKTLENDGYEAVLVGVLKDGCEVNLEEGKKSLSQNCFSVIKEFPMEGKDLEGCVVGSELTVDMLEGVEKIALSSISKGKGFTGAMKKHNFHGGPAGHGSKFHRALGSIGNRKPTRTHKGKKMHGHHGSFKVTMKNIPVELINKEASIIGVRGGVPGARNTLVSIFF